MTDHPTLIIPDPLGVHLVVGDRVTWLAMTPVELVHMAMRFNAAAVQALDADRRCQASPRGDSTETLAKSTTATATATAKCTDTGSDVAVKSVGARGADLPLVHAALDQAGERAIDDVAPEAAQIVWAPADGDFDANRRVWKR